MFVGGGSASTAGGIKVMTNALLFLAIAAEGKGDENVRRRTLLYDYPKDRPVIG